MYISNMFKYSVFKSYRLGDHDCQQQYVEKRMSLEAKNRSIYIIEPGSAPVLIFRLLTSLTISSASLSPMSPSTEGKRWANQLFSW